jgi:hypothetical protein
MDKAFNQNSTEQMAEWRSTANAWLRINASFYDYFTSTDLVSNAGTPTHPNQVGAVLLQAVRKGIIRPVGYRRSTSYRAHGRMVRLYEFVPQRRAAR